MGEAAVGIGATVLMSQQVYDAFHPHHAAIAENTTEGTGASGSGVHDGAGTSGTNDREASGSGEGVSEAAGQDAKFPSAKELGRRLGVSEEEFHRDVKKLIKKQFRDEIKSIDTTNPDIGIDKSGKIVLKNPDTGKTINTGVPLDSFGE